MKKLMIVALGVMFGSVLIWQAGVAAKGPPSDPPGNSETAIVHLGTALDDGREVDGYAFIHYKKGYHHRPNHDGGPGGNGGGDDGGGSTCFAFLANGASWNTTESYVVDPVNGSGMNEALVRTITSASLETWDTEVAFDIFGVEDTGAEVTRDPESTLGGADTNSPDDQNEVMFGDLDEGVIGVTVVWGVFRGPPFSRGLVEWDTVFNDVDFGWSTDASGSTTEMDYGNVATHEFGHSAGMGHPDGSCTEETMYGFASEGETKKRDLNGGDIAGINELY